jgi:hypothetical protein
MPPFLTYEFSHFFVDDLAAIIAGNIGSKFVTQSFDPERKTTLFLDQLADHCTIADQPVNYSKTVALCSTRAISAPMFVVIHTNIKEILHVQYVILNKTIINYDSYLLAFIRYKLLNICI